MLKSMFQNKATTPAAEVQTPAGRVREAESDVSKLARQERTLIDQIAEAEGLGEATRAVELRDRLEKAIARRAEAEREVLIAQGALRVAATRGRQQENAALEAEIATHATAFEGTLVELEAGARSLAAIWDRYDVLLKTRMEFHRRALQAGVAGPPSIGDLGGIAWGAEQVAKRVRTLDITRGPKKPAQPRRPHPVPLTDENIRTGRVRFRFPGGERILKSYGEERR